MSAPLIEPTTPAPAAPAASEPAKPEAPAWTPPASQADLDRIIADRLSREKAKYADYEDVKTKAAEYDKAQEAAKTEAQKQAEAFAKLQEENEALKVSNLRAEVAQAKGVPAALLTGTTKEALEAAADALIAFRGEALKPPAAPSAAGQGKVGEPIGAGAPQLTADDLARMTAAKDYDGIAKATAEGRFSALLSS